MDDTLWSLFVQDDIQLRPNLTVNMGLRYEQQTFTDSRKDFAPRAGFSHNLRGDGKTVIRGGFGIYYSQIVDNSAANWALTAGAPVPLRSLYVRPGDSAKLNRFFPTSTLIGYQDKLMNPYSDQWTFGIERRLATNWVLAVDYVGSHTLKINRPLTTGTTNSGDTGGTADRPVIDGVVIGRNTGRGRSIYEFSPFLERPFALEAIA